MNIHATTAWCNRCNSKHPANLVCEENNIYAVLSCPGGEYRYKISSDAEMFQQIRQKSWTDLTQQNSTKSRFILNYISVTKACNFSCAVCGVNAVSVESNPTYLSVDEICRRAEKVKTSGSSILHLIGGEPTLHPDLLEIISQLKKMGFSLGIVTNGYLLGQDETLAYKMKQHGVSRICLQFDSFKRETLDKFNRDYLDMKQKAIRNTINAGLSLGLNCTTTTHNLHEIKDLLSHHLELGHSVKNMTFASAAPVGRFQFSDDDSADREQIVKELLKAGDRYHFSYKDVFPLPAYLPWGMQVHPDCGAHLLFVRTPDGIRPWSYYIDIEALYRKIGKNRMKPSYFSKRIVPAWYLLRVFKIKKIFQCLKIAFGLIFFKKKYSLVNVGISNYKAAAFLDTQRTDRCVSAFHTSVGPVKGCLHFFRDETYPGSHEYELLHESC